jgi:hypothetical protein
MMFRTGLKWISIRFNVVFSGKIVKSLLVQYEVIPQLTDSQLFENNSFAYRLFHQYKELVNI